MFCQHCGKEVPNGAKFCTYCGGALSAPIQSESSTPTNIPPIYDRAGNLIDPSVLLGVYKNDISLARYFQACTDYSASDAKAIISSIKENITPAQMNFASAIVTQGNLEAQSKPKTMSKRERIKENKSNAVACCPKCGSTSLSANKKGFGVGKAVIGAAIAGPIGLVGGNLGAKKLFVTCLNCGHRWKM